MPIDEPDARGGREMFVDDPFKGEVRPFALMAAEIRSVGVRVLPFDPGVEQCVGTVFGAESGLGVRQGVLGLEAPVGGDQVWVQAGIVGIFGRSRVVDEIAVEVDVVLGRPREMGKSVGVEAVDQKDADVVRERLRPKQFQPGDLCRRAGVGFQPVRTTDDDELPRAVAVAEVGYVDAERLAVGARLFRVGVMREVGAGCGCMFEETGAGGGVMGREEVGEVHEQSAVSVGPAQ